MYRNKSTKTSDDNIEESLRIKSHLKRSAAKKMFFVVYSVGTYG
jgi:hypothetical protein